MGIEITQEHLLVVEGKDDANFFASLANHVDIPNIQVEGSGGKTQLRALLQAIVRTPGFDHVRCLGVTRDADEDPQAAFQSVCSALKNAGLPVPTAPLEPTEGRPRVAVFILPRSDQVGILEDLCLESLAQTQQ